jgi:hypothetical protein
MGESLLGRVFCGVAVAPSTEYLEPKAETAAAEARAARLTKAERLRPIDFAISPTKVQSLSFQRIALSGAAFDFFASITSPFFAVSSVITFSQVNRYIHSASKKRKVKQCRAESTQVLQHTKPTFSSLAWWHRLGRTRSLFGQPSRPMRTTKPE